MLELKIDRVSKYYKNKRAVDNVTGTFSCGVHGLLGANGAGKTTLLRMICGILFPSRGEILCDGAPIEKMGGEYRRLLGYLPQNFGYYPEFTAGRYMMYLSGLKALPKGQAKERTEELLELVGLKEEKNCKIKTFSGGMIRRLGIAQTMLNQPEILILDEPTSGLDPSERIRFRNIISSLGKDRVVILSTHIVSDVEFIADHIWLMKDGQFLHDGSIEEVTRAAEGNVWEGETSPENAELLNRTYAVSNLKNEGDRVHLRVVAGEKPWDTARPAVPGLEDVYLYYFREAGEKDGLISK